MTDQPFYRLTIPMRDSDGGDIVMNVDDDSAIPLDRIDHLADLEWVVMHVERLTEDEWIASWAKGDETPDHPDNLDEWKP